MTFVKPWEIPAAAVTGRVNIDTDIGCCRPRYRNSRYWINTDIGYYDIKPDIEPDIGIQYIPISGYPILYMPISGYPILNPILNPI